LRSTAPATSHPYTLSLHDALPISANALKMSVRAALVDARRVSPGCSYPAMISTESVLEGSSSNRIPFGKVAEESRIPKMVEMGRSEEHTSELQSRFDLVCRLLLEK